MQLLGPKLTFDSSKAEDLGDYDLLNPSSTARRKQVLLEEGWPRGELPSKVGLREHMQARAALQDKVGLAYHGNAALPPRRRWTSDKWSTR